MTTDIREKVSTLLERMCQGAFEREEVMALSLLSALAGESIFLLGLPGVGKSMVARRLKTAFAGSTGFEYLMSRFSTPDEIFGPVSISKLKDEDTYERVISGYMPEADIVFLDEIWKAGPAIQNSLLTAINEKIFRNGDHDIRLPLKGLIAASNELPAEGEGLEALWDRFLIRYVVEPISSKENFVNLIDTRMNAEPVISEGEAFSIQEYEDLKHRIGLVSLPDYVADILFNLRSMYADKARKKEELGEDRSDQSKIPYVSDRRWKKIVWIMKASALLNGRAAVNLSDCLLLEHMIWDHDSEIEQVRKDVAGEIARAMIGGKTSSQSARQTSGPSLYSPDRGRHYVVEMADTKLLISAEDYSKLTPAARSARIAEGGTIALCDGEGDFMVRLSRPGYIAVNSYVYPLKKDSVASSVISRADRTESLSATASEFMDDVKENIFLKSPESYDEVYKIVNKYVPNKSR